VKNIRKSARKKKTVVTQSLSPRTPFSPAFFPLIPLNNCVHFCTGSKKSVCP
jgi:hypothetical protein